LAVLGPKWEGAIVIFAGFTMAALACPLFAASAWLFASQGRGKDWVLTSAIMSGVTLCSFLAGLPFGPAGVAIFYSASCVLIQLPFVYYIAGRLGPVSRKDLWTGSLRHLPAWGVVCGTAWLARTFVLDANPWMQSFLCGPVALLAGRASLALCSLSWRVRLFLAFVVVLSSVLGFRSLYPFLAITHRADAIIVVVDGWIDECGIRAAVAEFRSSEYEHVFATGGPVVGSGEYINDF